MNKELEQLLNESQENHLNEDYEDLKINLEKALEIVREITEQEALNDKNNFIKYVCFILYN